MRNCDNCEYGSYGLDCNTGVETLYCREVEYEFEVQPNHVCDSHRFIDGFKDDGVLGYDCDGNEIGEFRILRFPFSADIENWDEEPNVDPRFYCLVRSSSGETLAVSVYDDWSCKYIRKYEQLDASDEIPMLIKPVSAMRDYEVAFDGITGNEWYYDRNRNELRREIDYVLKEQKGLVKSLVKKLK